MKISAIIPNYNGARTIEKTIKSIYAQKVEIKELIVVDDASTDDSVKLVKNKFPEVCLIEHTKNQGAAKSRNDGIKNSKGDFLLFVDSDVYLSNFSLKVMFKYVNKFDILYPTVFFENGKILSPSSFTEKKYIRRSPVFLIKRDALNKLDELFDENYGIYYEDVDFFTRCYLAGLKSKYLDNSVAYHAVLETSNRNLERRFYLEMKNQIYCIIKFLKIPKSVKESLALPKDIWGLTRAAFSNKNIFSRDYPDHTNQDRLSNSRIKLIYLLFKAILWNIFKLKENLEKQKLIRNKLIKQ